MVIVGWGSSMSSASQNGICKLGKKAFHLRQSFLPVTEFAPGPFKFNPKSCDRPGAVGFPIWSGGCVRTWDEAVVVRFHPLKT